VQGGGGRSGTAQRATCTHRPQAWGGGRACNKEGVGRAAMAAASVGYTTAPWGGAAVGDRYPPGPLEG
jgi:hypothetical protein